MKLAARPPLIRLAAIDKKLRSDSFPNATILARALEVNPRTIHRDIEFMRDRLHAPIKHDPRKRGYYYTDPSYEFSYFSVSEGEYIALFLAERLLQQYRSTPFAADISRLFAKVVDLLPEPITIDVQHLNGALSVHHHAADPGEATRFARLHQAARASRQLEIVYWTASRNETSRRIVDPYHLASVDGDWYLIAYCHRREDVLMFAPPRIQDLRETGQTFERPADFSINDYLEVGFRKYRGQGPAMTVRLRFTPAVAHLVRERQWHKTQELHEAADGSLELTFRVNHLLEVKRLVLWFGADCEVMEPEQLRAEIAAEARKILERR
jgi:proteasome accessory factor B